MQQFNLLVEITQVIDIQLGNISSIGLSVHLTGVNTKVKKRISYVTTKLLKPLNEC